jgi:hypothetical protein
MIDSYSSSIFLGAVLFGDSGVFLKSTDVFCSTMMFYYSGCLTNPEIKSYP